MGLGCYTGNKSFLEHYRLSKLSKRYSDLYSKTLGIAGISHNRLNALKLYYAFKLTTTGNNKARRKALEKIYDAWRDSLRKVYGDRVRVLEEVYRKLRMEGWKKNWKTTFAMLDVIDKVMFMEEYTRYPVFIYDEEGNIRINERNAWKWFRREIALLEGLDANIVKGLEDEFRKGIYFAKFGDFRKLEEVLTRLNTMQAIEELPHLSWKTSAWAGVMGFWTALWLTQENKSYEEWYTEIKKAYEKRGVNLFEETDELGKLPSTFFGAVTQAIFGKTHALASFLHYSLIESDNLYRLEQRIRKYLHEQGLSDSEMTAYFIAKLLVMPFAGEYVSQKIEDRLIAPVFVKFLQKGVMKNKLFAQVLGRLLMSGWRFRLTQAIFNITLSFAGGF